MMGYTPSPSTYGSVFSPGGRNFSPTPFGRRGGIDYSEFASFSSPRGHWRDNINGHNNSVDINRIEKGLDVRTTVSQLNTYLVCR